VLARADLTDVHVLVDPLRKCDRCGQPGHRIQRSFLIEQVPAVGYPQTAGREPVGVLRGLAFGDADQQLTKRAQPRTHTDLQAIER
jgi:hypothetical protein